MTLEEVIEYFGSLTKACKALGIVDQNVTRWKRQGYVSLIQQHRLEEMTNGALKAARIDPRGKGGRKSQKKD